MFRTKVKSGTCIADSIGLPIVEWEVMSGAGIQGTGFLIEQ